MASLKVPFIIIKFLERQKTEFHRWGLQDLTRFIPCRKYDVENAVSEGVFKSALTLHRVWLI